MLDCDIEYITLIENIHHADITEYPPVIVNGGDKHVHIIRKL